MSCLRRTAVRPLHLPWILAGVLLVALDLYLIGWRWADVGGNILAQFVISTPQFVTLHVLSKRRADRHHAETQGRLDAQDETLAAAHAQVGKLHQLLK